MGATRKPRVLVVDDADDLREVVGMVLENAGFDAATLSDVDEAFEYVKRERPDVVLTDVMMRGPRGLELITRIRSDLPPPLPNIVVYSGFSNFREEALRRGALAFLVKPVEGKDLVAAVRAALGGEPHRQQIAEIAKSAEHRTRELRRSSVESASRAMEGLAPQHEAFQQRAQAGVTWLASYLEVGSVFVVVIDEGKLRVIATSGGTGPFDPDEANSKWLEFVYDVLESQSTLVLPDARRLLGESAGAKEVGLFVGVPVFGPGHVAIGTICVTDPRPRNTDPEDIGLLVAWGRAGSAVLGGAESARIPPMFAWPGLLTRRSLMGLIRSEAERARVARTVLGIAVLKLPVRLDVGLASSVAASATGPTRRALAALDDHTLGMMLVRRDVEQAREELSRAVSEVYRHGLIGAGIAAVETPGLQIPGIDQLLNVCEAIAEGGEIERLVIRGERWQPLTPGETPTH